MHSTYTLWKYAPRPNYVTNIDRDYPYSEMPFLAEYELVKIPLSLNQLIDHVDYWGEGRVVSQDGVSGFPNCYNVNHSYQLVSNGANRDRKIPNRIPVASDTDCNTSAYIRDNSVVIVTVAGDRINSSSAKDIARIVNNDVGKVIVLGLKYDSQAMDALTVELAKKSLYLFPDYELPTELEGITRFKGLNMAFISAKLLKDDLFKLVNNKSYDRAVDMIKKFDVEGKDKSLSKIVWKLLSSKSNENFELMTFAYKLWIDGGKDIVTKYFPDAIKLVLSGENVTIVNYQYGQALKLDMNVDSYQDRWAWGHNGDKTTNRVSWQFIPVWLNNEVTFKLYNVHYNMYMKIDVNKNHIGDRRVWGSSNSGEDRHRYYVQPYIHKGTLVFFLINQTYRQGLKLAMEADNIGDRALWGHNGSIYDDEDRYKWCISAW